MEYVKAPYRVATSSTAKRTYISTVLFVFASVVLLAIAALAYPIFYYNYVPKKLISVPLHLQYNAGPNPYGILTLTPTLMQEQAYDVTVTLTLPRSPTNLRRGNFMIALYALKSLPLNPALISLPSSSYIPGPLSSTPSSDPYAHITPSNIVFASRRPVLLPYSDPLVTTASRALFLIYHLLRPHSAETTTLTVAMGELIEFARGNLPLSVLVDVQAGQELQVYSSSVTLVARLSGLRWFMYNHRVFAFVACTGLFWGFEMVAMGVAWGVLKAFWGVQRGEVVVKREGEREEDGDGDDEDEVDGVVGGRYGQIDGADDGDTSPPPYRRVKMERGVKDEEYDDEDNKDDVKIKYESPDPDSEPELVGRYRQAADADDEGGSEEDVGRGRDKGKGTSFYDEGRDGRKSGQVRRRVSGGRGS
ncbi:putative adipose-regulatory protein-domain-containing protein [Astrocystis sublimbata]|nr:putative adipose-regulatory protein-domain-containing protein [Astrocystis sublimbata]